MTKEKRKRKKEKGEGVDFIGKGRLIKVFNKIKEIVKETIKFLEFIKFVSPLYKGVKATPSVK